MLLENLKTGSDLSQKNIMILKVKLCYLKNILMPYIRQRKSNFIKYFNFDLLFKLY